MIFEAETQNEQTLIVVKELKYEDKKSLDGVMFGLNQFYPYYMVEKTLIHFGGWLKNSDLEIYDFYVFIKRFSKDNK